MATESKTYNGWTNYETWCVNLWLTNEEGSYHYWTETANEEWESPSHTSEHWTRSQAARFSLADRLKNEIEEAQPDLGASMWADMLNAALCEVDWDEIANSFLEECEDEADEDDPEAEAPEKYESR